MKVFCFLILLNLYVFSNGLEGFLGTQELVEKEDRYEYVEISSNLKDIDKERKELIVLKYLNFDLNNLPKSDRIIISFDINTNNAISNVLFKKKSSDESLNKALESAIKNSAFELPKPKYTSEYIVYFKTK